MPHKTIADTVEVTLRDGRVLTYKDVLFVEDGAAEDGECLFTIHGICGQVVASYRMSDFDRFIVKSKASVNVNTSKYLHLTNF